jgi:signal transduction histidine kinase
MLAQIIQSNFGALANLDLLAVGIATATAVILGVVVFTSDRASMTNKSFLFFLLMTALYSVANYAEYQITSPVYAIWALRFVIFLAVWHAFSLFQLFYVFPRSQFTFPRMYKMLVVPVVAVVSALTLTPFVFSRVNQVSASGQITQVMNGPGIFIFGATVLGLILSAIYILSKKTVNAKGIERKQFEFVAFGAVITFSLLLVFNFIFPAFRDNSRFISFAPFWFLPFIGFTFYATIKHHLLNVKVISTEILTLVLAIITFFEVIVTRDPLVLVLRVAIFVLVLSFGVLLMRSVRREVQQRVELQRLSDQMKENNAKLEDLSRFKSQLLSLASHQIKSPLAAIKGFTSILLEGLYGPVDGKVKETLEKIQKSSNALVSLINTLLDVRKVEEGKMEYQFVRINLVTLIESTMEELEPLASVKSLQFRFQSSSKEIWVNADAQKLKQVIQNVIDNSIKYTPSGFVNVDLSEDKTSALFTVSDSGLGIPPDLIPSLFEEFIRDERVRKEIMGTGLGLYIARKIVEAHGGKIWAESKGANQGSSFHVALKKVA